MSFCAHIEQKILDGKIPVKNRVLGHIADLGQERFAQCPHILAVHALAQCGGKVFHRILAFVLLRYAFKCDFHVILQR